MPLQPHFKLFIEGRATLTRDQARDLMRQILAALLGALVADGLSKWLTRAINEG